MTVGRRRPLGRLLASLGLVGSAACAAGLAYGTPGTFVEVHQSVRSVPRPLSSLAAGRWCGSLAGRLRAAAPIVAPRASTSFETPLALGALALGTLAVQQLSRVTRRALFGMHARDPSGVRHVENRKQAREASIMKEQLEQIFARGEIQLRRVGDEEMMRRVRIEDVIFSEGCYAAYLHIGVSGDKLEQRQVFVWLARNLGALKTALAKRYKRRGAIPKIFLVESKYEKFRQMMDQAQKYPELNLPDPLAAVRKRAEFNQMVWKRAGMGDSNAKFPPWGYPMGR